MSTRSVSQRLEKIGSDVIGIDLGTTNSAVAVFTCGTNGAAGVPEILKNSEGIFSFLLYLILSYTYCLLRQNSGEPLTPSCVSFSNDATEPFVGEPAVSRKTSDSDYANCITSKLQCKYNLRWN